MKAKHILLGWMIFVMLFLLEACGRQSAVHDHASQGQEQMQKSDQEKKTLWTCPMHPQIKKEGPGSCPICHMDLVPIDEQGRVQDQSQSHRPEGHALIQLSQERLQLIGVKYGVVQKKALFKSIDAAGRVAFDPELYTAQTEYVEALKQQERVKDTPLPDVKKSAQKMVESAKLRLKILGLSDDQIARLRTGESPTTEDSLLLPAPGENIWVYAEVFEMDLAQIDSGLQAKITGSALENKELFGEVVSVDRVINPTTRTAKVRVLIPNAKAELRPEAYVNVAILVPLGQQVVVPFDAILDSGKESWVFVAREAGHFEPRTVTVKFYAGDEVALGSGLEPGEKIVTSANFLIDSESRLKSVLESASDSQTSPQCPEGQEWHEQMKHCMPKLGG